MNSLAFKDPELSQSYLLKTASKPVPLSTMPNSNNVSMNESRVISPLLLA